MSILDKKLKGKHSDKLQNIMGAPPSWMQRWGMLFVLALLATLISLFKTIKYPEIIKTTLTFHSNYPTSTISMESNGEIVTLLSQNNDIVEKGQQVAIVKSSDKYSVIRASKNGKLNYIGLIYEGLSVSANQTLFSITDKEMSFFGEINIPSFSNIQTKKELFIRVHNPNNSVYKSQKLRAVLDYTVTLPDKPNSLRAKISLAQSDLNAMRQQQYNINEGTAVDAEIVLNEKSLFDRIKAGILNGFAPSTNK